VETADTYLMGSDGVMNELPSISEIAVQGFRSLRDVRLELGALNVLIGANSAGKSNLLDLFQFLASPDNLYANSYACSGCSPDLAATVTYCGKEYRHEQLRAAGVDASPGAEYVADQKFHYRAEPLLPEAEVFVTKTQDMLEQARPRLRPDGSNLGFVLYYLQESHPVVFEQIVSCMRAALPDFQGSPGSDGMLVWREPSQNVRRMLLLFTVLLLPTDWMPRLILLDEPEAGLHFRAIELLADLLRTIESRSRAQVIMCTHSPVFVDAFAAEQLVVVTSVNGATQFKRLKKGEFDLWLDEYSMSELWQKNVFGE